MDYSMGLLFGLIGFAAGIYVFFAYYQLKTQGIINQNILLPASKDPKKCKDLEGYKKEVSPSLLVLGISCIIYGVVNAASGFLAIPSAVFWIVMFGALAVLVWFAVKISRLNGKYF